MSDYADFVDGSILYAADLNAVPVAALNAIGGDELEDGLVTALAGPVVDFTIGAEAGNVIRVTVQIKTLGGVDIAQRAGMRIWAADSAWAGASGDPPSGGIAAGTKGFIALTAAGGTFMLCVTDENGTLELDFTESGADTWYLHAVCDGRPYVSGAITFT